MLYGIVPLYDIYVTLFGPHRREISRHTMRQANGWGMIHLESGDSAMPVACGAKRCLLWITTPLVSAYIFIIRLTLAYIDIIALSDQMAIKFTNDRYTHSTHRMISMRTS